MSVDCKPSKVNSRITAKAVGADFYKKSISKLFDLFLHKSNYQANNSETTQWK